MEQPNGVEALRESWNRLAELLDIAPGEVLHRGEAVDGHAVVDLGDYTFVIAWTNSGAAAPVSMAADRVRRAAAAMDEDAISLVAAPFMGEVGRERCAEAGVAWIDLSGNARIFAPGLRVLIEGQPNRFKRRGRPSSAFAPKSARITRWLLMHPRRSMTQREIAQATAMDEGYTSRIVGKLEDAGLIAREDDGSVRVRDPDLLLDAWREDYDFSKHRILRGHVAARSSEHLLEHVSEKLRAERVQHAVTGLGAAWLFTGFAGFRLVTVFASGQPQGELLERLGAREDPRGANFWLVAPNDEGVFHGAADHDGVRCVHPVQAYLDLAGHPERSREAAEELRARMLTWNAHA